MSHKNDSAARLQGLQRQGGPTTAVAAKPGTGFISSEAFAVRTAAGTGTRRLSIACALSGRTVTPDEELQWVVFPEAVNNFEYLWDSTAAAVDLESSRTAHG